MSRHTPVDTPTQHPGSTDTADLSRPALKAAFKISDLWDLDERQLSIVLGHVPRSTLRRWRALVRSDRMARVTLAHDQIERISYLLGIYKALHILLPRPELADGWVKAPNKAPGFDGRTALDVMCQGSITDLQSVRRYLDAQRGG